MLELARARFDNFIKLGLVEIREHDLRTGYPAVLACVTNCVLTLQFTPIEYPQRILSDIYETTMPGGALVEEAAMRKKTFSEEQIALALRDAGAGTPVTEVCRMMGVSEQSFNRWKKKYLRMGIAASSIARFEVSR